MLRRQYLTSQQSADSHRTRPDIRLRGKGKNIAGIIALQPGNEVNEKSLVKSIKTS